MRAGLLEADMLASVCIYEATCILESIESTLEKKLNGSPKELLRTPRNSRELQGTSEELQGTLGNL